MRACVRACVPVCVPACVRADLKQGKHSDVDPHPGSMKNVKNLSSSGHLLKFCLDSVDSLCVSYYCYFFHQRRLCKMRIILCSFIKEVSRGMDALL